MATTKPSVCTPPLFGKFGTKAKDLFKKKYDFDNQLVFMNKSVDGLDIETSIVSSNDQPLRGVFKSKMPFSDLGVLSGKLESEFHTVPDRESKTTYQFTRLATGLLVKLGLSGIKPVIKGSTPDFPEGWASAEVEYQQEYVSTITNVRTNQAKTLIDSAVAIGYDRLSVGGKITVDAAQVTQKAPDDFNFGAQYDGTDYVVSLVSENKRSALNLSYFQQLGRRQTVGAVFTQSLTKPARTLTFGTDYQVDPDTTLRAFAKVDSGKEATVIGAALEHKLLNPNVKLGVAAEFNATPAAISASKFGVTVTVGDF